jgi:hypothetical protein
LRRIRERRLREMPNQSVSGVLERSDRSSGWNSLDGDLDLKTGIEELEAHVRAEIARWGPVVRASGAKHEQADRP